MGARRWNELSRPERRRAVVHMTAVIGAAWVVLVGGYYLLPLDIRSGAAFAVRLTLSGVLFVVVLVWQLRHVMRAELPAARAVEAFGVIVPLFLVIFASTYLALSHESARHFNEPLNHTDALYLTVTVFTSVGFGDVVPRGDLARILVSVQMLVGLIILGAVARLLINAATRGRS